MIMILTIIIVIIMFIHIIAIPKRVRAYFFQSVKIHYLFSGPISVDPICPQPKRLELLNG